MNNKKIVGFLLLIITPFIAYYFLILGVQEVFSIFKIKDLVGVVAILSGVTGIVTGFSSSRQASLDAVKNYFQQGDEDAFSNARKRILDAKETDDIDSSDVSKICNFFHFWGLMNRQRYLPIWVFDSSSGFQIVKLYLKLEPIIKLKRIDNRFYAIEFEYLAYRIYKKYKGNFESLASGDWKDKFEVFKINSNKLFSNRYKLTK